MFRKIHIQAEKVGALEGTIRERDEHLKGLQCLRAEHQHMKKALETYKKRLSTAEMLVSFLLLKTQFLVLFLFYIP